MVNKASSLMPKTFFSLQVSLLYMNLNFLLSTSAIVHTCVLLHDAATHSCLGCKLVEKECALCSLVGVVGVTLLLVSYPIIKSL